MSIYLTIFRYGEYDEISALPSLKAARDYSKRMFDRENRGELRFEKDVANGMEIYRGDDGGGRPITIFIKPLQVKAWKKPFEADKFVVEEGNRGF